MKKIYLFLGIIVIVFSLAACSEPSPGNNGNGGKTTTYTVTYNINGGTGTMPVKQTVNAGESVTLAGGNGFSKSGYIFSGWNTNEYGTGTNYSADSSYTPTGSITLYAKWNTITGTTYTVTFNVNGGSGTTPSEQTVQAGYSITLPYGSGLTKTSYIFGGWNTDPYGTGTNYSAGSSYTPTGSITLYAKWNTITGTTYTVTFNANGGSGTTPSEQTVQAGYSITIPDMSGLTYSGYIFDCWNTDPYGTGTNYQHGDYFTPASDITLYARWYAVQTVSPDRFEYYWVDQHGSLVTTSGGAANIVSGEWLTITTQEYGYVVKQWYLNSIDTGQSENTYYFSSTTTGEHNVDLFVEKDGKLYNTSITITVKEPTVPATPTGVSASAASAASSSSITVRWTAVSNANGYYVYRSSSPSGTYSKVEMTSSTSYTNTGLSAGTTYYYKVSAYNNVGEGSQSAYASARTPGPPDPPSLTVTRNSFGTASLSWTAVSGATSYNIYRGILNTNNGTLLSNYQRIINGRTTTTYIDSDTLTTSGYRYIYQVTAVNSYGESAKSNAAYWQ